MRELENIVITRILINMMRIHNTGIFWAFILLFWHLNISAPGDVEEGGEEGEDEEAEVGVADPLQESLHVVPILQDTMYTVHGTVRLKLS